MWDFISKYYQTVTHKQRKFLGREKNIKVSLVFYTADVETYVRCVTEGERKHLTNCKQHRKISVHRAEQHPILSSLLPPAPLVKRCKTERPKKMAQTQGTNPQSSITRCVRGKTHCVHFTSWGKHVWAVPVGGLQGVGEGWGFYEALLVPQRTKGMGGYPAGRSPELNCATINFS